MDLANSIIMNKLRSGSYCAWKYTDMLLFHGHIIIYYLHTVLNELNCLLFILLPISVYLLMQCLSSLHHLPPLGIILAWLLGCAHEQKTQLHG